MDVPLLPPPPCGEGIGVGGCQETGRWLFVFTPPDASRVTLAVKGRVIS